MDYKILFIPRIGHKYQFEKEYETQEEAETALTAISLYTLMLHDAGLMPDFTNCGVVAKNIDGEWAEVDE